MGGLEGPGPQDHDTVWADLGQYAVSLGEDGLEPLILALASRVGVLVGQPASRRRALRGCRPCCRSEPPSPAPAEVAKDSG